MPCRELPPPPPAYDSRNFTLSPETTDCDSADLESELSVRNRIQVFLSWKFSLVLLTSPWWGLKIFYLHCLMSSSGSLSSRLWRLLSFLWPKNPHFHAHTWGEFCLWHTFCPYLRWAFLPCGDIGDRGRITPNPKLTKEGEENNQIVVFVVGVKFIRQSIDY